jgi:protease I
MSLLDGRTIAFLVAPEGVEQAELVGPWEAVLQAGGRPVLISTQAEVQAYRHLDRGEVYLADHTAVPAGSEGYDALVLPGGAANADHLRTLPEAVAFTRDFFDQGKPVAAICHAPWLLIEAGVVGDRVLTSWPSLRTDLTNAGARWVDTEVQVCTGGPNILVTSRKPDDLPQFNESLVNEFAVADTVAATAATAAAATTADTHAG